MVWSSAGARALYQVPATSVLMRCVQHRFKGQFRVRLRVGLACEINLAVPVTTDVPGSAQSETLVM